MNSKDFNDDMTKTVSDYMVRRTKRSIKKKTYKAFNQGFSNIGLDRRIKNHKEHIKIQDHSSLDLINIQRKNLLDQRNDLFLKSPNLRTMLGYMDIPDLDFDKSKEGSKKRQKQYNRSKIKQNFSHNTRTYQNINFGSNEDNFNLNEADNLLKQQNNNNFKMGIDKSFDMEGTDNFNKFYKESKVPKNNQRQKRINQRKMKDKFYTEKEMEEKKAKNFFFEKTEEENKKSIFNNPLVARSVGERNLTQKILMSPATAVSSFGASLKENLNEDIENNEEGLQLANSFVSPIARKLSFEGKNLVARKVGFDRRAYNLGKIEKKIMKTDKKIYKQKMAQRKRMRRNIKNSANNTRKVGMFTRAKNFFLEKGDQFKSFILNLVRNRTALLMGSSLLLMIVLIFVFSMPSLIFVGAGGGGGANSGHENIYDFEDTIIRDDTVFYTQYDPSWSGHPLNIARSGCGPTSMAMVISTLTGRQVFPPEIATFALNGGHYIRGVGSSWSLFPSASREYGLNCDFIASSYDLSAMKPYFDKGALIVFSGRSLNGGGHIMVATGIEDNKLKLNDPASISRTYLEEGSRGTQAVRGVWAIYP